MTITPLDTLLDPDARLDWVFDWTGWLEDGETITSYELIPEDCTVDGDSQDGGRITVWTVDPSKGAQVTCRVTTSAGRTDDRTMHFVVVDR